MPTPFFTDDHATLYHGDALQVLPTLPPASVHLICVDPPYYKTKMDYAGEKLAWDRQWPTSEAYLGWLRSLAQEWQRILTPNGSLYCFASPQMAAYVEVMLGEIFEVLNHIVWVKADKSGNGQFSKACKEEMRAFFPQTERIVFCAPRGADSMALGDSGYAAQCETIRGFVFEPLRRYLAEEFAALGWTNDMLNQICGTASMAGSHYTARSQWRLPTAKHYAKLQAAANGHLRREYEDLRRPFTVSAHVPYTDVWDFATVPAGPGKHPCEKPLPLLRHIITVSSRPGDTVLDCCAGSCSTLEAAQ